MGVVALVVREHPGSVQPLRPDRRRGTVALYKRLFEPAASLAEVAAGEPEAPERGSQAKGLVTRAVL